MIPALVNPRSGKAAAALAALRTVGGFDVREVQPGRLREQVQSAIGNGARRVLVAGGDGSIGSAAAALAGTGAELAILPCGTLNHLARDLALPLDLRRAARVALTGSAVAVDAALMNDRIFLNTSSVGAYVTFVRTRDRLERRLHAGYHIASFISAIRLFVHMPVSRVSLHVDGEARAYVTPLVFIGVGERELKLPQLGARIPGGRTGLHVMVVRHRSAARAIALGLAAAARGVHAAAQTPAMDAFLVDHCRVEPRTRNVSLDGEIVRAAPPLRYRHVPGHLRVVMPNE
jgi:diacylglycerol kinase family enzyme